MGIENDELDNNPFIVKTAEFDCPDEYLGIGYELMEHMIKHRTEIAQYDLTSNSVQSYGDLLQKSISTAASLKTTIQQEEDPTIAIFSSNHMDISVPVIASHFLGYKVNAYDCLLMESDISALLQKIPPSVMFIEEQHVEKMEIAMELSKVRFKLVVFGKTDKHNTFESFCEGNGDFEFEPVKLKSGHQTGVIMFSSGTTGLPKGICLSHNSLLKQAIILVSMQNLTTKSVFLHFSSYNWITAHIILISCTLSGASRVISPISSIWESIQKYKVTHISAPPYLTSLFLAQEKPEPSKNESVLSYISAGSRLNEKLYRELNRLLPRAFVGESYGQTEAAGWITMFQWHKKEDCLLARKNPESVGKLWPGFYCKVVDIETEEILGPNKLGELRLKSTTPFMNGYYKKDASDAYDSTGWLKTGDLGYYDDNHCFYILERCKEMLKFREFHIRPQKLEAILESHEAVEKAVVIGVTHPEEGEHPKGIVVLKDGAGDVSADEIRAFVDGQVEDRLRLRAGVQIVESIPLTSTGKPKRRQLKDMVERGRL